MQKNIQPMYTLPCQVPIAAAPSSELIPSTVSQPKRSRKTKESKRKQVKNACINCQKACKKCDEGRACQRCIKLGIESTCVDSPRKERLRGMKRGPYKKRQPKNVEGTANQLYPNDQDKAFAFDQDFKWLDNTQVVDQQLYQHQPQHIQYQQQNDQHFNNVEYTTYQDQPYQYRQQQQQQKSAYFTSDATFENYSYYSSPSSIDQSSYQHQPQKSSINSTPSPLTNSFMDHYSSPISSSSSSISPVSSTMPLPQDVLQSMFTMNDLDPAGMDVFVKQEVLDYDNSMMMMPLQETPILNWSTTSGTPASDALIFDTATTSISPAAPHLTQPVYQHCQQQQQLQQIYIPQQSTQYIPFY